MLMFLFHRPRRLLLQFSNIMFRIRNLLSIRLKLYPPPQKKSQPTTSLFLTRLLLKYEKRSYRSLRITTQLLLPMPLPLFLLVQLIIFMFVYGLFARVVIYTSTRVWR